MEAKPKRRRRIMWGKVEIDFVPFLRCKQCGDVLPACERSFENDDETVTRRYVCPHCDEPQIYIFE